MSKKHPVIFIHGLFMNPSCWDNWMRYFKNAGYPCYAPAYPFHQVTENAGEQRVDRRLEDLTFDLVVDSIQLCVDRLAQKPILIGHSMGGLIVQKLIESDSGVAGICIEPAPPAGIFSLEWSFVKAHLPTVNPFKGNSVCEPSLKWVNYAIFNTMTLHETAWFYNQFIVPESRNVPRTSIGKQGKIDLERAHNPLLFIAGEKDNSIPPSLVLKNFKAYKDTTSRRNFREFEGRTHGICLQENWQEVAQYCLDWINDFERTLHT